MAAASGSLSKRRGSDRRGRDQARQPAPRRPAVGIGKSENVKFHAGFFNRGAEIVDLVAAIACGAGDYDVHRAFAGRGDALQQRMGRILRAGHGEENFIGHIVELREREEIFFEAGLQSLHRTQHGDAGQVETRRRRRPPPRGLHPANALAKAGEGQHQLDEKQEIKDKQHPAGG